MRHSRQHVARTRDASFMLCLQLDGVSINRQQGREAVLRYGDFHLLDSSRPYEVTIPQSKPDAGAQRATPELARRMPNPESVVGIAMSGRSGVSGLLSSLLCNFWQQRAPAMKHSSRPASAKRSSIWWRVRTPPSRRPPPEDSSHRHRPPRADSQLHRDTPARPGAQLPVVSRRQCILSPRRLHQLFEADSETVGAYILRRRLEECARAHERRFATQPHGDRDSVPPWLQQRVPLRTCVPRALPGDA